MTLAFVVPLMFATCDLGEVFSKPDAWVTSAVDFAAEHRNDGFRFASRKQDIVNCMGRGKCTWHGLEVWEARVYFGTDGATRVEMSMYNRGDDRSLDGLGAFKTTACREVSRYSTQRLEPRRYIAFRTPLIRPSLAIWRTSRL